MFRESARFGVAASPEWRVGPPLLVRVVGVPRPRGSARSRRRRAPVGGEGGIVPGRGWPPPPSPPRRLPPMRSRCHATRGGRRPPPHRRRQSTRRPWVGSAASCLPPGHGSARAARSHTIETRFQMRSLSPQQVPPSGRTPGRGRRQQVRIGKPGDRQPPVGQQRRVPPAVLPPPQSVSSRRGAWRRGHRRPGQRRPRSAYRRRGGEPVCDAPPPHADLRRRRACRHAASADLLAMRFRFASVPSTRSSEVARVWRQTVTPAASTASSRAALKAGRSRCQPWPKGSRRKSRSASCAVAAPRRPVAVARHCAGCCQRRQ